MSDPRWSDLVDGASNASVFHHRLWLRLVRDVYRYPMTAVCLADGNGRLLAGMPIATVRSALTGTRLVSVPFSDICGPVVLSEDYEEPLLAAIDRARLQAGLTLEVHSAVPGLPEGLTSEHFYHHLISLDGGVDGVLSRVKPAKRSCASRARRHGVSVTRRTDAAAVDAFYRLHVLTRRKLGVPTQPRRFFRGLPSLFAHGLGFVLLLEWHGQPVAAGVYLRHGSTLTYKYGASDPAHLDKRPNDLLHLDALALAHAEGCSILDLGRTELDNPGLRRFKRSFGAQEHVLSYTCAPASGRHRSVRSVPSLQRSLIRRAPSSFGRLVGAVAYRHFA